MSAEALFRAIQEGSAADVSKILATDRSLARSVIKGTSALMMAAFSRKQYILAVLADTAAPLTLHEAAVVGDTRRIDHLVHAAADAVHGYADGGWTALHLSAAFGHVDACSVLIDASSDVNAWSKNEFANQPIHAACAICRSPDVVAILLDRGADINARQHGGYTPLHEAAGSGDMRLLQFLVDRGADATIRDDEGKTAHELARDRGKFDAATALT